MTCVTVRDMICFNYREGALFAFGIVCSWVAIYFWMRSRDDE